MGTVGCEYTVIPGEIDSGFGHQGGQSGDQEVSPLKRVLLRAVPELADELVQVVNVFDPWARDRGEYYSLKWMPRPGAESDESF